MDRGNELSRSSKKLSRFAMRKRFMRLTISLTAAAALSALRARAATYQWIGGTSGTWGIAPTNVWSPTGLPNTGDTVNITSTLGTTQTITYNYSGTALSIQSLTIDLTHGSASTSEILSLPNTESLSASVESIGNSATGSSGSGSIAQSAGTNTIGSVMQIGFNSTDTGVYNLSGTGSVNGNGTEEVGLNGTGSFVQSGGSSNSITGYLAIAANTGSVGTYTLSSTATASAANVYVGGNATSAGGKALLAVSGSASLTTSGVIKVYNTTGDSLSLSGGSITASSLNLSGNANGLIWTGGSLMLTDPALGGIEADNSANANIPTGQVIGASQTLIAGADEQIGESGSGSINQSGGSNTFNNGTMYLGFNVGATGTYTLSSGMLTGNGMAIGVQGTGAVNQSGGTFQANPGNAVFVAYEAGSHGTYNLSGTGMVTADGVAVGVYSAGVFNQSGGNLQINTDYGLELGMFVGSSGTYVLSGTGSLLASGPEYIGYGAPANFNQTGGTNSILLANTLYVGYNASSNGDYQLGGGSLTAQNEIVGSNSGAVGSSENLNGQEPCKSSCPTVSSSCRWMVGG